MHRTWLALGVAALASCEPDRVVPETGRSSSASANRSSAVSAAPSVSAVPLEPGEEEAVLAFFDDIAERSIASFREASKRSPKSRVGYAESLALTTPAAFARHRDLMKKRGLSDNRLSEITNTHPDLVDRAVAQMMKKIDPVLTELGTDKLAVVDADDCTWLVRRLIELRQEGEANAGISRVLSSHVPKCLEVLPEPVKACLPSGDAKPDVAAFDACVKPKEPAKK